MFMLMQLMHHGRYLCIMLSYIYFLYLGIVHISQVRLSKISIPDGSMTR